MRRLASAKSFDKSLAESLAKSLAEPLGKTFGETLGETFCACQVSRRELRIGFYAWLLARLSETRFFYVEYRHKANVGYSFYGMINVC